MSNWTVGKNNDSTTAEVNAVIGSMYLPSCKLLKWDDNGMCYFCQRDGNIVSHMDGYTGLCNGCKDKRVNVSEPERKQYSFSDREDSYDTLLWDILAKHLGHSVVIAQYGNAESPADICLECEDCGEVLLDAEIYTICAREDV